MRQLAGTDQRTWVPVAEAILKLRGVTKARCEETSDVGGECRVVAWIQMKSGR
ncbi:MAG TPA: hypothetical protein VFV72_07015 [Candidatus Limnocylindrales bacterium]|nr:hypothetical protein [Candidatus Limnocylindrales bacterium]